MGYAYRFGGRLRRILDWLRGSRTFVGVDIARCQGRTVETVVRVRMRRDGVRVLEAFERKVIEENPEVQC